MADGKPDTLAPVHTEPNALDRLIQYVAPGYAVKRVRARAVMAVAEGWMGGYIGGRYNRNATKTWFTQANSADIDTVYDLPQLRARSRDLIRNTPIATGAVGTMIQNVIGSGLSLQAQPDVDFLKMSDVDADKWTDEVEREFRFWCESADCDITRTQNFYALQGLAFRAMLESGDCFVLLPMKELKSTPYQLRVQVIEADRIGSPGNPTGFELVSADVATNKDNGNKIVMGVEKDQVGAPIAYHISDTHPSEISPTGRKFTRVPVFGAETGRRNALHLFQRDRPDQSRGVPFLAPVIEPLKMLDRYTEAELMGAVVGAMFTVFVETEAGEGLVSPQDAPTALTSKNEIGLGNGTVVDLVPGEKVSFADPKRPNSAFDPFVEAILRQIGVALGLPFEVLVKHFTASYSAARAALLQAWLVFKNRRDFMATHFCQPIYEAFMDEAIALDRIQAPGYFDDPAMRAAYLGSDWIGDTPGQLDPVKEVEAATGRLDIGVSDKTAETMALTGRVYKDTFRQQVKEKKMGVEAGLIPDPAVIANPAVDKRIPKPGQPSPPPAPAVPPTVPPKSFPPKAPGADVDQGENE